MKYSLRSLWIGITLFCVYLGSYSAMLQPVDTVEESFGGMAVSGRLEPHYRFYNGVSELVFAPAVWFDKLVRPSYWKTNSDFAP